MSKWHSSYLGKGSCILDHVSSLAQISSSDANGIRGKVPKILTVFRATRTFALLCTTLFFTCSHIQFIFNIQNMMDVPSYEQQKNYICSFHVMRLQHTAHTEHSHAHKQSLFILATFKFGLIPNSWPQNFKTKVVSLDLCTLQLRMKRAGHSSKAINFDAENIINGNV